MNINYTKTIKLLFIIKLFVVILILFYEYFQTNHNKNIFHIQENKVVFGDNSLGYGKLIVPNIIHFIRFGNQSKSFDFVSYITLKSVLLNQKPDRIYIHCNCSRISGKYWDLIEEKDKITVRPTEMPTHVFGHKLDPDWQVWHASDITRLEILMQFGGIYLDNDVYVLKKLDKFRAYEMCIGWDKDSPEPLGNQVLIAHKQARFLRVWFNLYRMYDPNKWYFNAGELPSKVLAINPQFVHKVNKSFGITSDLFQLLYKSFDQKLWDSYDLYSIHLLVNHRYYLDPMFDKMPTFDENNIKTYPTKFGALARVIFYGSSQFIH